MHKVTVELWNEDNTYDVWIHHFLSEIECRAFALGWRLAHEASRLGVKKTIIRINGKEV